jgi:hypothetical protein
VIFNNSGIYSGFEKDLYEDIVEGESPGIASPATALLPQVAGGRLLDRRNDWWQVRYERLAEMVGMPGRMVHTQQEVGPGRGAGTRCCR